MFQALIWQFENTTLIITISNTSLTSPCESGARGGVEDTEEPVREVPTL